VLKKPSRKSARPMDASVMQVKGSITTCLALKWVSQAAVLTLRISIQTNSFANSSEMEALKRYLHRHLAKWLVEVVDAAGIWEQILLSKCLLKRCPVKAAADEEGEAHKCISCLLVDQWVAWVAKEVVFLSSSSKLDPNKEDETNSESLLPLKSRHSSMCVRKRPKKEERTNSSTTFSEGSSTELKTLIQTMNRWRKTWSGKSKSFVSSAVVAAFVLCS